MYTHTFKITLANGDEGELAIEMPSDPSDSEWENRVMGTGADALGRVNALAVRSWTIAAQSGARKAGSIEDAQAYVESYRSGERASPVAKRVVVIASDLGLTDEQISALEAAGAVVI